METALDDLVSDSIRGGNGRDWFFVTGAAPIYDVHGNHQHHGGGSSGHGHHGSVIVVDDPPALEGFDLIDSLDDLEDSADSEAIHTLIPHADDSVKRKEHLALFELVKYEDVTNYALNSGDWSNPSIWSEGIVPSSSDRVLIPLGVTVDVDTVIPQDVATVRVDGTLNFANDVNTQLRVDTMIVSPSGRLQIGTAAAPIADGVTAELIFTDNGPIDRDWDPFGISRGLITHGAVEMYGAATTSYIDVVGPVAAGATSVTLSQVPADWQVGDQVVLTGTVEGADQDEVRDILAINGNTIQVAALAYDHTPPEASLNVHVANLTRNVVISSEATEIQRRGHTMFMHNRDVDVNYVAFNGLGRSDKLQVVNDAVVDANWDLVPGTGTNVRARYAVHFHRNGHIDDGNPAVVHGSVAVDSFSWAFVNHSSFAAITDNVAFRSRGSAFVGEAGDEIGSFERNIAIATEGSGEKIDSREPQQDFAHAGSGFWFQGAGISVVDNVSAGNDGNAFVFYTRGLRQSGVRTLFNTESLVDPSIANGAETILVDHVPVVQFDGNEGYASDIGLTVRYHLRDNTHSVDSVFENSTFWNNEIGVTVPYSHDTILRDLTIIHDQQHLPDFGVTGNGNSRDITYENLTVTGYSQGINVAQWGHSQIIGGTFSNIHNIVVRPATNTGRTVTVSGPIQFVPLDESVASSLVQRDIMMRFDLNDAVNRLFRDTQVVLNYGAFNNQQAYWSAQHPDAVPFPDPTPGIPANYVGLTSQQLWDTFQIAVGGELAPTNATTEPRIEGLVGPAA